MIFENLKTGTILASASTGNLLKVTKSSKPITATSVVTVAQVLDGKAVRGTAKEMKADSLRRRYIIAQ